MLRNMSRKRHDGPKKTKLENGTLYRPSANGAKEEGGGGGRHDGTIGDDVLEVKIQTGPRRLPW